MKEKTILIVVGILAMVLLSVVSSLGVYYFMTEKDARANEDALVEGRLDIMETWENLYNPPMKSVNEARQMQQKMRDEDECDSVFKRIPDDILVNVVSVVLGRNGAATVTEIVQEFKKNYRDIYQYIRQDGVKDTVPDTTNYSHLEPVE